MATGAPEDAVAAGDGLSSRRSLGSAGNLVQQSQSVDRRQPLLMEPILCHPMENILYEGRPKEWVWF